MKVLPSFIETGGNLMHEALLLAPTIIASIAALIVVSRLCRYRIRIVWRENSYFALEPIDEPPKPLPAPKPKTRTKKRSSKRR